MARRLLPLTLVLSIGAISGGSACVIPPDLQPADADAGPSSPPVLVSAQPAPDFSVPGPMVLQRPDDRVLVLEVVDHDAEDSTYVRLYVDYNRAPQFVPLPPLADCQTASTGEVDRLVSCSVNALCNTIAATDATSHVLEAVIADRPFIPDSDPQAQGQPLYRALADPQHASFTIPAWNMQCATSETQ